MIALEVSLFMKGLWFDLKYRFFEGRIYQEYMYTYLKMRQAFSQLKPFFA